VSRRTDVIAVDWSGKRSGAEEHIWLARVRGGVLVELENGRSRRQVVDRLLELGREQPRLAVGLDFGFSFPAWYLDERGWFGGRDVWSALGEQADELLAECPWPFWGPPGRRNVHGREAFRRTETEVAGAPKSVFQIGGAGAVGTGSIRGMPHLARLSGEGFSVWPFDEPGRPRVVEIYPRLLTEAVVKRRHRERLAFLNRRFAGQPEGMRERAAGSEDAFDAAVSALVMAEHGHELQDLPQPPGDSIYRREGRIWAPGATWS
jgi:hypothetical protein